MWGRCRFSEPGAQSAAVCTANQGKAELSTYLPQPSHGFTQRLEISGRDQTGPPFEQGNTESIVHIRPIHDPREALIEQQSCQRLGNDPVLAAKNRDVQTLKPMGDEDAGMFHFQPLPDREVIQAYEPSGGDLDTSGGQGLLLPPNPGSLLRGGHHRAAL
jgi:hypothetical protein